MGDKNKKDKDKKKKKGKPGENLRELRERLLQRISEIDEQIEATTAEHDELTEELESREPEALTSGEALEQMQEAYREFSNRNILMHAKMSQFPEMREHIPANSLDTMHDYFHAAHQDFFMLAMVLNADEEYEVTDRDRKLLERLFKQEITYYTQLIELRNRLEKKLDSTDGEIIVEYEEDKPSADDEKSADDEEVNKGGVLIYNDFNQPVSTGTFTDFHLHFMNLELAAAQHYITSAATALGVQIKGVDINEKAAPDKGKGSPEHREYDIAHTLYNQEAPTDLVDRVRLTLHMGDITPDL